MASVAAGIVGAKRLAGTSLGVGTGPAKVRFAVAAVLAQVAGATPCMETGPASWFATNPGATSTPLASTLVLGVSLVMAAIWAAEALASQEEETEGTSSTRQALQASTPGTRNRQVDSISIPEAQNHGTTQTMA